MRTIQFKNGNEFKIMQSIADILNEKIIEGTDIIDGVEIKTHIVRYDLKTDFKDKKRKKNQDADDDDDD